MINFLETYWWVSILLVILLALVDYYLTVAGAKYHSTHVARYISYQNGYELNPLFEKNVAEFHWLTRKNAGLLLLLSAYLALIHLLGQKELFEFFIGAGLMQWLFIDLKHLQNQLFFRDLRRPNSIAGNIQYSYWLTQRSSASGYLSQAVLFVVAALATERPFFWGAVFACTAQGLRGLRLANRKFPQPKTGIEPESNK